MVEIFKTIQENIEHVLISFILFEFLMYFINTSG